jgi:hypothetical protein
MERKEEMVSGVKRVKRGVKIVLDYMLVIIKLRYSISQAA